MSNTTPRQLLLLADHLKLSLLERQRAVALNLEAGKQDAQISQSLTNLQEGLQELENQETDLLSSEDTSADIAKLRQQYSDLYAQFHGQAPPSLSLRRPNNPSLADDFAAAQTRPAQNSRRNKNVRFRDDPDAVEQDAETLAARAALFDPERYTDEPSQRDQQSQLDNQQIHAYHTQVLSEQDAQLDVLGQSVSRTRILGIQMGDELDEQAEMLGDVESGVDRHAGTLGRAQTRLNHVARKAGDNWSWVTIGILICVLVLLIIVLK